MRFMLEESGPRWKGLRPVRVHSVVLTVAGVVYIAVGLTHLTTEPSPSRLQSLVYALNWLDYNNWGYVWILVGLMSIISSRWPPASETWGYTALTGQATAWALFYGAGVVFAGTPTSNLIGILAWGLLGFMWIMISRLVNPEVLKILLDRIQTLESENLALHDQLNRRKEERG